MSLLIHTLNMQYICYIQVEILYIKLQLVQRVCTPLEVVTCAEFNHQINPTCTILLYIVQLINMEQLVQAVCTSCNLYRFLVQVATCTKSQLVHNIYRLELEPVF